ncbi:MAG: uroporphyrin-III C-methyltransferase, partial [Yersinia sp. (in: enterobacteria)]
TRQEEICQRLIDGGKSPDTPAAAVMYASQQRQEIAKGTLTTLKDEIVRKKLHAPALLVIGHVVNLSDVLAFTARQIDISHEPLLQVI